MTTPEWTVGMEVLTDPIRPTKIERFTPTGIIVTEDGRKFRPDGRFIGRHYEVLRPATEGDAAIRAREAKASELMRDLGRIGVNIVNMERALGRGFGRYTPDQATLDRTERFLAAVAAWEATEKERKE